MIGKRIRLGEYDHTPEPILQTGVVLGEIPDQDTELHPTVFRIAMDDGWVLDKTTLEFDVIKSDITDELLAPELPNLYSADDAMQASRNAGLIYELMQSNAAQILEVEQEIARRQAEIASEIRGEHADLYESQRVTVNTFARHEERGRAGAMALWFSAGQPDKGKTFGAFQVAEETRLNRYDAGKALAFARAKNPNLISTTLDRARFTRAVRDGKITVKSDVCEWVTVVTAKTLTTKLIEAAHETPDESE